MDADHSRLSAVRADVGRYYSGQIGKYGATPAGVGWTCRPTQELRFIQLCKLFDFRDGFSVNDIGCGYGALFGFLRTRHRKPAIDYLGIDVSQPMVDEGRRKWRNARFELLASDYRVADYCVASGIFNIKLGHDRSTWEQLTAHTLGQMYARSRNGVAVNFLRDDGALDEVIEHYRCLPGRWIDEGRRLGASVELLDRYGMPEFTLLLRRQ